MKMKFVTALVILLLIVVVIGAEVIIRSNYEREQQEELFRTHALQAARLLGGKIHEVTGPDGRQALFSTDFHTTRNAVYTYGFVNSDLNTYGVTKEELEGIVMSGGNSANSSLTPEQQAEVIETYANDWVDAKENGADWYMRQIDDYLDVHPELSAAPTGRNGTKDIEDCTYEELQKIIVEYNNSLV